MANIDTGKLVIAGLSAGIVINIVESVMNLFVLAEAMDASLTALNLPAISGAAIGGFVVLGFVLGFLVVWTYAAIRPRFGPGPATAMKAGVLVWIAFYLLGAGANWLSGVTPTGLYATTLVYSLIMMLAAAYVGGMLYKED